MTQQTLTPSPRLALVPRIDLSARTPGQQPLFYYAGAYLTWSQLERRLRPIAATAA
jgi:hypothetical protein